MNKKGPVIATLAATAVIGTLILVNKANHSDTERAGPPEIPPAQTLRTDTQSYPFSVAFYNQGEFFENRANSLIDRIKRSIDQDEIDGLWPEVAKFQIKALDSYTKAMQNGPNSRHAAMAGARIRKFYPDPFLQESHEGQWVLIGDGYELHVKKKIPRERVITEGKECYTTAIVGLELYDEHKRLLGYKQFHLSPEDWTIGGMVDEIMGK